MGNLNYFSDSLAFLAWTGLFVPVRVLPRGAYQFFTDDAGIIQLGTMVACVSFLRGVACAEEVTCQN